MDLLNSTKSIMEDFISLFYPELCLICTNNLLKHEECICTLCLHQTPKTDCFKRKENEVSKRFWGRVQLENAAALFQFNKEGNTQKLIHRLKYEEGKNIGAFLGKQLGYAINESEYFKNIDIIFPVPLHPKKQKLRGYNQSNSIAKGLKEILKINIDKKSLIRIENTDSQTRKKRFSRWENMMNSFALKSTKKLNGKHILLIDDVITTGSTLEACAQKLLEIEGVKVSIATIAVA
ncbi:MAG: ComF family protein [Flavobacteriales bacterium]|nr:ComF family protein [Flavobacteriales bacterium]